MQWKLPGSVSSFVQRAGRAARASGRTGLAVLLVEQAAYGVDLDQDTMHAEAGLPKKNLKKRGKKKTQSIEGEIKRTAAESKKLRDVRGARHGGIDGKHDAILVRQEPRLDVHQVDEGLHTLVQTGVCWCAVLTKIYNNKPPRKQHIHSQILS